MDHNMNGNSSKELLYSEYTGTSVTEHVLETLEKKSARNLKEKIVKPFGKKGKSETFERVRKLMGLIEKEQDISNASNGKSNASLDIENKEGIEVVMEVDENSPESNINAWFFIDLPKEQESKYSEDEAVKNSSAVVNSNISTDTSDDESVQNFPIITNQFVLNDTISSISSNQKKILKPSSKVTNNALNFLNDDASDTSNDEFEQNFPVISNGFTLNNHDSSNCSSVESETNLSACFKLQNSSNCFTDDSSNSSDGSYSSNTKSSVTKENQSCTNSDTLQLSISLKKDKRKFKIVNNMSAECLNCESVNHYSHSSDSKMLSCEKKTMFIVNNSSDHLLNECEYSRSLHNEQKHIFEGNCSDSSSNMGDVLVSGKVKITDVLESESTGFIREGTGDCVSLSDLKKRKYVEDEISNVCDAENSKRICILDRKI